MYDPKQVSEMLGLPPSTVRRYASQYGSYLSESARREGRKRAYTPDDVRLLERIRELTAQRKSQAEIERLLGVIPQKEQEPPNADIRLAPYVAERFDQLRGSLADMRREQQEEANDLRQRLDRISRQLEEQQARPLPWWRRLFTGKRKNE